eukprot:m.94296 g.94296  ORF g.94296 m.94296 type:complete len:52 (+) comp13022_c0_seq3:484-639(+)
MDNCNFSTLNPAPTAMPHFVDLCKPVYITYMQKRKIKKKEKFKKVEAHLHL